MTQWKQAARAVADVIADRLAAPDDARRLCLKRGWWPQSLAHGAAGVALLHIERARADLASWQHAHNWLACAATAPAVTGVDSHLHYGAPALAFALQAAADRTSRYSRALSTLDQYIAAMTRHRVERAHARMDRGELPALAEFDTIRGLTGLGALLLQRETHTELTRDVLTYLVRLAEPVTHGGDLLPGWWSSVAPSGRRSPDYPDGHANNGVAHGICGPLALLSLAARRGITVDGHISAIGRICSWLDRWQQNGSSGPWWPYWITRSQLHSGTAGAGPSRPSWCYGTAGIARAQQLAAVASGQLARQQMAEQALLLSMTDPQQRNITTDLSLCHGFAGLAYITQAVASDAIIPGLANCLGGLLTPIIDSAPNALATRLLKPPAGHADIGLLEGATGVALALHGISAATGSASGWDTCFLIN